MSNANEPPTVTPREWEALREFMRDIEALSRSMKELPEDYIEVNHV